MSFFTGIMYNLCKKKLVYTGQRKAHKAEKIPMNEPIDFVVTWVDGNDPEWKKEKEKYERISGKSNAPGANGEERYRDWDVFQYWFRAVEEYAPWVRNVYVVTCGQIPDWMNINAPKVKIVNHKDFIPNQYLPTFSSIPIELNLHRIEGLSEYFVYFNDDMFINKPVMPEDFFNGGRPNYTAAARPLKNMANDAFEHMQFATMAVINKCFGSEISQRIQAHADKWFSEVYGKYYAEWNLHAFDKNYLPGMLFTHLGVAFRKSTMEKVWSASPELLHETCLHRFRTPMDVIHQVFSIWEMLEGDFNPVSHEHHGKVFCAQIANKDEIVDAIINEKYRMICINDSELLPRADYAILKEDVRDAFQKALPKKSQYEKD